MESTPSANTPSTLWQMPYVFIICTLAFFTLNTVLSLFINALLILIMNYSPSLRTPPNSHLMNICANNIILCLNMIFSMFCINFNTLETGNTKMLSGVQIFMVFNCMLQYWGTFAGIGYYRHKTIKNPSLSLSNRRRVVSRCITGNWIVSLLLSMVLSMAFSQSSTHFEYSIDPFRREYSFGPHDDYSPEQLIVIFIFLAVFIIGLIIVIASYHSVCKMLNITGRFAKNRIVPVQRTTSQSTVTTDLTLPRKQSDKTDVNNLGAYSISEKIIDDDFIVHYQKCDHSLAFEDIIALENPILASRIREHYNQKRLLKPTLSTGSTASAHSKCPEFSDLSVGASLERYQTMKNNSILRDQSLKRDRINLSSATKNSLVMLLAFVVCSFPLIICSIPDALNSLSPEKRIITILFCRFVFCINAPVYPLWYLLFSKRIRTCVSRLSENILIRMKMRI